MDSIMIVETLVLGIAFLVSLIYGWKAQESLTKQIRKLEKKVRKLKTEIKKVESGTFEQAKGMGPMLVQPAQAMERNPGLTVSDPKSETHRAEESARLRASDY